MENKEIRLVNLRQLLSESKTAAALAYAANTSPSYISQVLSSKMKGSIGDKLARRLEIAAGKPKGWLDLLHHQIASKKTMAHIELQIPFVELDRESEKIDSEKFCVKWVGDSMLSPYDIASSICPGDVVIINRRIKPSFGDFVLVRIKKSLKIRKFTLDGNEPILQALNGHCPIIPITCDMKFLGVVIEIRRKLRDC